MTTLSSKLCATRYRSQEIGAELASQLSDLLEVAEDERSLQAFLNIHPEPVGWRFALGACPATLVRPQFRLGSDFIPDFMVVDAPQWTQVTLVELKPPTAQAFKADGGHAKHMVDAVGQTTLWKSWVRKNLQTFQNEVLEAIHEVKDFGDYEALYRNLIIPRILTGNFRLMSAIVIGRHTELHRDEYDQHVVDFIRNSDSNMVYSYDALVDVCGERS